MWKESGCLRSEYCATIELSTKIAILWTSRSKFTTQSRRHGRTLVGLAPLIKLQAPQMETWNTINQWSFVNFWNVKPPCTKEKPPIEDFLATVLSPPQCNWEAKNTKLVLFVNKLKTSRQDLRSTQQKNSLPSSFYLKSKLFHWKESKFQKSNELGMSIGDGLPPTDGSCAIFYLV